MKISILISLYFILLTEIFANTLYIKGLKTKMLSSPKHGSSVINILKRGQKVTEIRSKGIWKQVDFVGHIGWLPKILLSTTKPTARKSLLNTKHDISIKARKRASSFTSSAAARGMLSGVEKQIGNLTDANYKALKKLQSWHVPSPEGNDYLIGSKQ